jgi:hypothetical protein
MLAQILQIRRLLNQSRNLINHIQFLTRPAIPARQLLLNSRQDLQRSRVLNFLGLNVVGRRRNGRSVSARLL